MVRVCRVSVNLKFQLMYDCDILPRYQHTSLDPDANLEWSMFNESVIQSAVWCRLTHRLHTVQRASNEIDLYTGSSYLSGLTGGKSESASSIAMRLEAVKAEAAKASLHEHKDMKLI